MIKPDLEMRPATMDDFEGLSRVFENENAYHTRLVPNRIQSAKPILDHQWLEKELSNANSHLAVAVSSGEIVALVHLRIMESPEEPFFVKRRYLYIQDLGVLETYRGRGIGHALMDYAKQYAHRRQLSEIELHVWEKNDKAQLFYEKLGYKTIRRQMGIRIS